MNILQRIINWIGDLFKSIPKEIKEYASIALEVTTKIRHVLDNPITVSVVNLTPTSVDNEVREKLVYCIDLLIGWLRVETLEQAIDQMRTMPPKMQNATLIKLASEITAHLDGNELKESNYDIAVQAVYSNGKLS